MIYQKNWYMLAGSTLVFCNLSLLAFVGRVGVGGKSIFTGKII